MTHRAIVVLAVVRAAAPVAEARDEASRQWAIYQLPNGKDK